MRKLYFVTAGLFLSGIAFAQSPEFKKAMDAGTQKFKIKQYNLAIMDYSNAIKIIDKEVDKLIASKTAIPDDKKYMLEPYLMRAQCNYYMQSLVPMKTDVDKYAKLDSTNSTIMALKGYEMYKTGKKGDGCVAMKKEAMKDNQLAAKAYKDCFCVNEGVVLLKEARTANNLKKYDEALPIIEKTIMIMPDSGSVYAEKGEALLGKGDMNGALKAFNSAISMTKKNHLAYYQRAHIFMKLNKLDSAMEDLNSCLKLHPNFFDAYMLRVNVAEQQELWNSVVYDLKNCIKLHPSDGKLDFRMAEVMNNKQNNLLDACTYYKSAFAKGNEDAEEMNTNCNTVKYMKQHLRNK